MRKAFSTPIVLIVALSIDLLIDLLMLDLFKCYSAFVIFRLLYILLLLYSIVIFIFLFFYLWVWYSTMIDLYILNCLCIPRISTFWSGFLISFLPLSFLLQCVLVHFYLYLFELNSAGLCIIQLCEILIYDFIEDILH